MVYHTTRDRGYLIIHLSSKDESYGWLHLKTQASFFYVHGYLLWFAWGVLGFWQIASVRYLKPFFKPGAWFHIISGMFILLITLVFSIRGIAILYWTVSAHWHAYIGMFITVATIFVPIGGFTTWYYALNSKWSIDFY